MGTTDTNALSVPKKSPMKWGFLYTSAILLSDGVL